MVSGNEESEEDGTIDTESDDETTDHSQCSDAVDSEHTLPGSLQSQRSVLGLEDTLYQQPQMTSVLLSHQPHTNGKNVPNKRANGFQNGENLVTGIDVQTATYEELSQMVALVDVGDGISKDTSLPKEDASGKKPQAEPSNYTSFSTIEQESDETKSSESAISTSLSRSNRGRRLSVRRLWSRNSDSIVGEEGLVTTRNMWKRRHAKSAQAGIRREKVSDLARRKTTSKLSSLFRRVEQLSMRKNGESRRYAARTLSGLLNALAEEVSGLDVQIDANKETPLWSKEVDSVEINFSRLGFKPQIRMGGKEPSSLAEIVSGDVSELSADEAFEKIDVDNSGYLDTEELAQALKEATPKAPNNKVIDMLASKLVKLYDFNGDGAVDRDEYQKMVEDMAALREEQEGQRQQSDTDKGAGLLGNLRSAASSLKWNRGQDEKSKTEEEYDIEDHLQGSIVFSDLKLDLRRLVFGGIPVLKHVTPGAGGPLVLEPFNVTIRGSFNRDDVMNSSWLDQGLRLLVAQALRRRVRSFRDIVDGAVFFGRTWKMTCTTAPFVEVGKLTDVQFDDMNRIVVTGWARVRTSPDAPLLKQSFKVRMKLGSRKNGQCIRMVEPELALVVECPESWEAGIDSVCKALSLPKPPRPKPLYSFFPIYSPFKVQDNDGFDLGPDNCIKAIYVKDHALRFEMSAVWRPGRFLGNHYLAFTLPNRTFIMTLDRVKEAMRTARKNKQAAKAKLLKEKPKLSRLASRARPLRFFDLRRTRRSAAGKAKKLLKKPAKSFFSRFVEGYTQDRDDDDEEERLSFAVSDFFGKQGFAGKNQTMSK